MNTLEKIVKSEEYQKNLEIYFSSIGYKIINNNEQQILFDNDFIKYEMDTNDIDNRKLISLIKNTYWFWSSDNSELYGLLFNPKENEYTAIVELDSEWTFSIVGYNLIDWIDFLFEDLDFKNIPEKVKQFKLSIESLNTPKKYKKINEEELFNLYT